MQWSDPATLTRSQFLKGALGLGLSCLLPTGARATTRSLRLVQWSDVHWGSQQDAPDCWREAFRRGLEARPELALLTGDQADNGPGRGDFGERLRAFWGPTLEAWPEDLPLLLTLGNADFRENYQTDPPNLRECYQLHRELLGRRYYLDEEGRGVARHSGLLWISLNTQVFSPKNRYPGAAEQTRLSLAWLQQRLQEAERAPVVLLLHIPPCRDLFNGKWAWTVPALQGFWSLVSAYCGPVSIVSGHFHRNEVHAFARSQGEAKLLVAGSLSRKYDYQPNWRIQDWALENGQLKRADYRIYYPGHDDFEHSYTLEQSQSFLSQVNRSAYGNDLFSRYPQGNDRWKELSEQFWVNQADFDR